MLWLHLGATLGDLTQVFQMELANLPILQILSFAVLAHSANYLKFKMVMTHSFPDYWALSHLFEDDITGRLYMFSGCVERSFLHHWKRKDFFSFSDIWVSTSR
ncbi:hypothetical protein CPB83DRAFT_189481 [Crepidotus variabilis]|uniref:Uncharacterized protein n=1 Tax=Crepidotus variabilis TaxID=179855 RepID=A0A9P6JS65_9AGAR|nr:hypothetical protein CPB83DRAFT_189481 [Crepidotus variabilis]